MAGIHPAPTLRFFRKHALSGSLPAAYPLSYVHLEEMRAERGVSVAAVNRWGTRR